MTDGNQLEEIREAVQRTYSDAIAPTMAMRLAGYTTEQLAEAPPGVSSFGCGNPLAYASVRPGDVVLDLGSGAGLDLILAAQVVGPTGRVVGVDMTDSMIARARANVGRAGMTNVEIRKGLIEELPVADASIDWVISNCVISLSPQKERVFAEIARVLRPGGRMLISDIVVDERVASILRRLTRITPSIAMARTDASYLAAIERAGLVDGRVEDRLVYDASQLTALFAPEILHAAAAAVPLQALRRRIEHGALVQRVVRRAAEAAAGRVSSAKIAARRPPVGLERR